MPRYYFHVHYNGEPASTDAEGVELAGDDAAWAEATGACGQMISDLDGVDAGECRLAHGGGERARHHAVPAFVPRRTHRRLNADRRFAKTGAWPRFFRTH